MTITNELREYAPHLDLGKVALAGWKESLLAIADRIDAEHQKALDEWKAKHGQMWLKGYSECHAELLEGNETLASDLERCGWTRLPKDVHGEYIRIGDVMAYEDNTKPMEVVALVPPAVFLTEDGPRYADMCRHYKPPTTEDVLREMADRIYADEDEPRNRDAIVAEYAKRLTLAGDAE